MEITENILLTIMTAATPLLIAALGELERVREHDHGPRTRAPCRAQHALHLRLAADLQRPHDGHGED